jgi:hypothetical protein
MAISKKRPNSKYPSAKKGTVRSLAFLGWAEGPEASTETRPPDLWLLAKLPCLFPCSAYKTQELPVTQLARYVDLFHLVITDNQRPETLSLLYGLAPPIKPTTHFSQSAALWTREWHSCCLVPNKSFFSTCGMVFIWQFLIGTK